VLATPRARRWDGEAVAAWLLALPATVSYLALLLLPTLAVVVLAFTDYELGVPALRWIGFDNFVELAGDSGFPGPNAVRITQAITNNIARVIERQATPEVALRDMAAEVRRLLPRS
jgi:ABC-type sugar transport system permease subunit